VYGEHRNSQAGTLLRPIGDGPDGGSTIWSVYFEGKVAAMATIPYVIEVDESAFQQDVIERSQDVPVVVDFWAPWCGPCRVLSPILTNLAQEYQGRFVLAKINVDENQRLAAQFGVQGIPMVKAFRDGRAVDEFVGAQPHPTVRQFIERLLPDPLEGQVKAARTLLASKQFGAAAAAFKQILAQQPEHPAALLGLAEAHVGQGEEQLALDVLSSIPRGTPAEIEANRLRREIELRSVVSGADEAGLRARVAAEPADLETRYRLASLLLVQDRQQEALDQYLEILRRDRTFYNGAARQAMLDIFERLNDQTMVRSYRDKLAMVLFV
jgi:putative thioredoxin